MPHGILVLQVTGQGTVKLMGSFPPHFTCSPKLMDVITTNYEYGSFAPWGDVASEMDVALCKVETTELGKEYIICLVADNMVDLREAAQFLNIIAPKLALAENLGKLEENFPKLAPILLDNLTFLETPVKNGEAAPAKPVSIPTGEVRICPYRMSLPPEQQVCIRERCMAYFGDINRAIDLLRQLLSAISQGGDQLKTRFEDLNQVLPKEGCFLIHGNPLRIAGLGGK